MLKHYIARFLARNLKTYRVLFFLYHLVQKFLPPQTVLGQWHFSLDPQFIWISPWLGWKAIYVETLYSAFLSAKFDNVSNNFLICHLCQKLFHSQTVLRQWHSSLDTQFIWISPWLGWKAIYVETLYSAFLSEIWKRIEYFFCIPPRSKITSASHFTRTVTLLTRPSIQLNKSLTRLKRDLCWNTI